jgi:hypothetical protein
MFFQIIGPITKVEKIASGNSIREIKRLRKHYGIGNWIKWKGMATICFPNGNKCRAELHWYEAHGIGKKEIKIKHIIE